MALVLRKTCPGSRATSTVTTSSLHLQLSPLHLWLGSACFPASHNSIQSFCWTHGLEVQDKKIGINYILQGWRIMWVGYSFDYDHLDSRGKQEVFQEEPLTQAFQQGKVLLRNRIECCHLLEGNGTEWETLASWGWNWKKQKSRGLLSC